MPKQKTHKGMKRRFKVTATGKVTHRNANRGHFLSHKGVKRTRQMRNDNMVIGAEAKLIAAAMAPGM